MVLTFSVWLGAFLLYLTWQVDWS